MNQVDLVHHLQQALQLVQAGDTARALVVLDATLTACSSPAPGSSPLPDGVLPWLHLARAALQGKDRAVPPFLALQTAIVLLEV